MRTSSRGAWEAVDGALEVGATYAWSGIEVSSRELARFAEQYAVPATFNAAVGVFASDLRRFGVRLAPPPALARRVAKHLVSAFLDEQGAGESER